MVCVFPFFCMPGMGIPPKKRTPLPFACGGESLFLACSFFYFFPKTIFFVPVILCSNLFCLAEDGWPIDRET